VFADPSIVNGDVPVSNSYVSTPTDHQSTACQQSHNSLTQSHVLEHVKKTVMLLTTTTTLFLWS